MTYRKTIVFGIALFLGGIVTGGPSAYAEEEKKKWSLPSFSSGKKPTKQEMQTEVRNMAKETLARLYELQPNARKAVRTSAGYAVFSNFGMKIGVLGSGSGEGIAINNKNKRETFMKMLELQTGLGLGIQRFRLVWVFQNKKDFDNFVNSGWELSGQTTAAAKKDDSGKAVAGAVQEAPGVWVYQMTEDGLALELTVKGSKYYQDKKLN